MAAECPFILEASWVEVVAGSLAVEHFYYQVLRRHLEAEVAPLAECSCQRQAAVPEV